MRAARRFPLAAVLTATLAGLIPLCAAASEPPPRLSGPHSHANLAVYFVRGTSAPGPVPLTLAEALVTGRVRVLETGNVNALMVENLGQEAVFIQSGDIVKGGQQDRVLTVSLLLPAKSGQVSIDSFCVEQGRWAARGKEDVKQFASAADALPSKAAKLAMKVPAAKMPNDLATAAIGEPTSRAASAPDSTNQRRTSANVASSTGDETGRKQRKVWDEVTNIQMALANRLGAKVAAPQSASSLQLSLENEALKAARAAYVTALESMPAMDPEIIGVFFAIDGKINSADVYPSHALFRKMWGKALAASVTEAIGSHAQTAATQPLSTPAIADVETFLTAALTGTLHTATIAKLMTQDTRDADTTLYVEARTTAGAWVHRNYLAK
jgi:hypothetical protein